METRICKQCGIEKPITEYSRTGGYPRWDCKACCTANKRQRYLEDMPKARKASRDWKARNPDKVLDGRLRLVYGITLEQFDEMILNQGGMCAICEREALLHVDHNHNTGKVRGLLCPKCNGYLGIIQDSVPALRRAIEYLQS